MSFRYLFFVLVFYFFHSIPTEAQVGTFRVWEWDQITIPPISPPSQVNFNGLHSAVQSDPNGISIVGDRMRFYVDPVNPLPTPAMDEDFNMRSEFNISPWHVNYPLGTEQWMGWRVTFGDNYVIDPTSNWLLFQVHPGEQNGVGTLSPQLSFHVQHEADVHTPAAGEITVSVNPQSAATRHSRTFVRPQAGESIDIVVHVIWGNDSNGRLQVWFNGNLVRDEQRTNVYSHSQWGGNAKWGIYKSTWRNQNGVQTSQSAGVTNIETFIGTLKVLTRAPSDPNYNQDAYDQVKPNVSGPTAPQITSQPQNQTVTEGQSVSFSVNATGSGPLSYQWQKNGSNISGATSASYTISSTSLSDAGNYRVRVSNSAGNVTSNQATLTVTQGAQAPQITSQPQNQSVTEGQTASFSVTATGTGPLSYQWQKNGSNISGATSANYSISSTSLSDAGNYRVRISNSAGNVTSNQATLTVTQGAQAPQITSQPQNQSVTEGQTASFSVTATGTGPLSYQWQKNGSNISGATLSSYSISSTSLSDAGNYRVRVSNSTGNVTSNQATLTVTQGAQAPQITSQPNNQSVTEGQSANFSVTASGTGPLSYQWRKDGSNISGATSASYSISSTSLSDAGDYRVVVTNSAGSVTSNPGTLTITQGAQAPQITSQPNNQSVTEGQSASFSVTATGTGPLSYQWRKDGSNISGATSAGYTINSTNLSDAGDYRVVVTNSAGSVTSNPGTLTVTQSAQAPQITSQPNNQSVTEGQSASFSVTATGTDPLSYQWRKDGSNISGATSAGYTINSTNLSDAGDYRVVVTNSAGSVTSNPGTLTVTQGAQAPQITSQPNNQSVTEGQSASFSVTATGTDPLSYQWRKDGSNISGATSAGYTINNTNLSDAGDYRVVVTNSAGSVTSNPATLTVTQGVQAPQITGQPQNQTVTEGQTVSFSVTASGTGPLSYQWQKDGSNISGAASASYSISSTKLSDAADYSVRVSNGAGNVTSSTATLSVSAPANARPVAEILSPDQGTLFKAGDIITFAGQGMDNEEGELSEGNLIWSLEVYKGGKVQSDPLPLQGSLSGSFEVPIEEASADTKYRLHLEVVDSQGLWDKTYIDLFPSTTVITYVTEPEGLEIALDGNPVPAPSSMLSLEGSVMEIDVPLSQVLNGVTYEFDHWNHGGPANQMITVPESENIYTAVFNELLDLDIYPNPFENEINIAYPQDWELEEVELFNVYGKSTVLKVKPEVQTPGRLKIVLQEKGLAPGIYLVKLDFAEWKRIVRRLVKVL